MRVGDRLERYAIEAELGSGGMGTVFRALDERLGRRVALKVVRLGEDSSRDEEGRARLLREARASACLDHPNAVSIFDVGEVDGRPFIAMELVKGKSLRAFVGDPAVPLHERVRWLVEVARALEAAHAAGLVHRDVKPENVMVREDGRVKVLDFGIARRAADEGAADPGAPTLLPDLQTLTARGLVVGTPMYMAPEQLRAAPVDGRADQFAWAVLAYELLSGRPPWSARDATSLLAAILTEEPPPLGSIARDLPAPVADVVRRALRKAPAERFATMGEIASLFEPFARPAPAPPREPAAAGPGAGASPGPGPARFPPLSTDLTRFSTEELKEVIERALRKEEEDGRYRYSEVLEAAREVGADPRAVREVARAMKLPENPPDVERRRQRQKLVRRAATWAVGSVALLLFGLAEGAVRDMLIFSILWGSVVAIQAVRYRFPVDAAPPKLPSPKRARREASERSWRVEEAAARLVDTARMAPMRIDAAAGSATEELARAEAEAASFEGARARQAARR